MFTASPRRKAVLMLLVMCLAASGLSASGPKPEYSQSVKPPEPASIEFFSRVWIFFQKLQNKEGCRSDPDGCSSQNPRPQPKAGCEIDPDGRCIP